MKNFDFSQRIFEFFPKVLSILPDQFGGLLIVIQTLDLDLKEGDGVVHHLPFSLFIYQASL